MAGGGARGRRGMHCVNFVPFSLEAGGVWGPAAKRFFKRCVAQADNQDRDVTSAGLYRAEQIDQRQGILLTHNDETADAPLAPS